MLSRLIHLTVFFGTFMHPVKNSGGLTQITVSTSFRELFYYWSYFVLFKLLDHFSHFIRSKTTGLLTLVNQDDDICALEVLVSFFPSV